MAFFLCLLDQIGDVWIFPVVTGTVTTICCLSMVLIFNGTGFQPCCQSNAGPKLVATFGYVVNLLTRPKSRKAEAVIFFGHFKIIHTLLRINLAPAKRIWKMIFLLNCCYRVLGKGTYSHPLKLTAKATEKMMGLDEDPFLSGLVPFRG